MANVRGRYPPQLTLQALAMMTDRYLRGAEVARRIGVAESRRHE